MALNIKNSEVKRLAHELADETGDAVTAAVTSLPDLDVGSAGRIPGYDEFGLPA